MKNLLPAIPLWVAACIIIYKLFEPKLGHVFAWEITAIVVLIGMFIFSMELFENGGKTQ